MLAMFIVAWRSKESRDVMSIWCVEQKSAEEIAYANDGVCFSVTAPIDFVATYKANWRLAADFAQACAETIGREFLKEAGLWVIPTDEAPA